MIFVAGLFFRCGPTTLGLIVACFTVPASSGEKASFVIPSRDGYGINECLGENSACGRVIADSWCEAHGLAKASSFGIIDDMTAAIPRTAAALPQRRAGAEPGSYVINCEP